MKKKSCKKLHFVKGTLGDIELSYTDSLANSQMVKDYIVALRANARQWSASTKNRSEVAHANFKPHPQKGTGNARQGCIVAPQYKGGGRVKAPRPKFDQYVDMNRKEKRKVVKTLFVKHVEEETLFLLEEESVAGMAPKTKDFSHFLKLTNLHGKKVLICLPQQLEKEKHQNLLLSTRNMKSVTCRSLQSVNGYDLMVHQAVVVMDSQLESLETMVRG